MDNLTDLYKKANEIHQLIEENQNKINYLKLYKDGVNLFIDMAKNNGHTVDKKSTMIKENSCLIEILEDMNRAWERDYNHILDDINNRMRNNRMKTN